MTKFGCGKGSKNWHSFHFWWVCKLEPPFCGVIWKYLTKACGKMHMLCVRHASPPANPLSTLLYLTLAQEEWPSGLHQQAMPCFLTWLPDRGGYGRMTGTLAGAGRRGRLGIYSPGSFPVRPPAPHHSLSFHPSLPLSLWVQGTDYSAASWLWIPLQIHWSINKPSLDYLSLFVSSASGRDANWHTFRSCNFILEIYLRKQSEKYKNIWRYL